MQETRIPSLGREDSQSRKWQPTPVFLPGKSHGQRGQVGYRPWGHKESDTTERTCMTCLFLARSCVDCKCMTNILDTSLYFLFIFLEKNFILNIAVHICQSQIPNLSDNCFYIAWCLFRCKFQVELQGAGGQMSSFWLCDLGLNIYRLWDSVSPHP